MKSWFLICSGAKNFLFQNKRYKKCTHFFSWAPTYHSFIFDSIFLCELKKVRLKHVWDFPFLIPFRFYCIKIYFVVQQKA